MATHEDRRSLTRQKILNAAQQLFMENGFDGTTIMQIIARANIVKGTFYQHFQTKMDLLVVLGRQDGAERVCALIGKVEAGLPALEALQRYYKAMAQLFEAQHHIAEDVIFSAISLHDPASDSPELEAHDFTRLMLKIARKRGEVRTDIDITSQAIVIGGAFSLAVVDWSRNQSTMSLQKRVNACFQVFLQGVQATSSNKPVNKSKNRKVQEGA